MKAVVKRVRMAEVAVPKNLFAALLQVIAALLPKPDVSTSSCASMARVQSKTSEEVRLDEAGFGTFATGQPKRVAG